MRRLSMVPIALLLASCSSELSAVFGSLLHNLAIVVPFVASVVAIIFLLNRFILKDGRTNERVCSIIGVIVFPLLFAGAFYLLFGSGWIPMTVAVVLGGFVGWFSYTLDEIMEEFWEERAITLPGTLGLLAGTWLIVTGFTGVWLEGAMSVTHEACAQRIVVERYDCDIDSDGDESCSWSYSYHVDRIVLGRQMPELREGRDYHLGVGDYGYSDRARSETYRFIGGRFWSEKHARWQPFRWLRLGNGVQFDLDRIQFVRSDFYGHPIANGGPAEFGDASTPPPKLLDHVMLPTEDELPPPTGVGKVFSFAGSFFGMLFSEREYRPLLWGVLGTVVLLVLLAIFVPAARPGAAAFVVAATIIPLLLMMGSAARHRSVYTWRRRRW